MMAGLGSFGGTIGDMIRNTITTAGPQNVINMNALAGSSASGGAGYQAGPNSANQNTESPKTLDAIQNRFDYGPSVVRHPGYSGYDITQMMMGNDPEFMSRINFGQQADRQAGGGTENTLAAMQYIIDRNKTRQQEIQQQMQQQTQQYMQPNSQTGFDVTQIANLPNAYNQEAIMNNINQYGLGNLAGLMGDVNIFGSR